MSKSTTTYNLAAGLVQSHEQQVLLVDIDFPQGVECSAAIWELKKQLKDVLLFTTRLQMLWHLLAGVDVVHNILLAEEEIPCIWSSGREMLRKAWTHW